MLPASVLWMPAWHAHEMLFGFALAVVAGNQLGPATGKRVWLLFALWLLSRITFLVFPGAVTAMVVNAAFAAGLAIQVAPRLARSAKKWRNRALPAILVALCVAAAASHVRTAVLLFAALMLFMGGRLLAPAVAGQLQRQGRTLGPRVQPRIEAGLLVAMIPAFVWPAACVAAGLLAGVRMLRWRLWALRGRPDLLCLAAGYGWLALVLLILAPDLSMLGYLGGPRVGALAYDVVHAHIGRAALVMQHLRDWGLLRGPLLATFHGSDVTVEPGRQARGYYDRLFAGAEAMTTNSEFLRGELIAISAASPARFLPEPTPVPIRARPMPAMIVRTSAKSTLMRPGVVIRSVMPATPFMSTSSARRKVSVIGASGSPTSSPGHAARAIGKRIARVRQEASLSICATIGRGSGRVMSIDAFARPLGGRRRCRGGCRSG